MTTSNHSTPSPTSTAEPQVSAFLGLSKAERDWLLLMAYLHLEQGKTDKAVLLMRLLFRAFPDDAEIQRCLALAELLAGNPRDAARAATRAIQRAEKNHRVPVGLVFARALWEQGKPENAREFLLNLLTDKND